MFAQKNTADSLVHRKFNLNFEFGNYYVTKLNAKLNENNLLLPKDIIKTRQKNYPNYNPERSLDNPLLHSAFYVDLMGHVKITDSTIIDFNLLAEHRGLSYGVYNTENVILMPQFRIHGHETLPILNRQVSLHGDFGNKRKASIHEGLVIYNIDVQGIDFNLSYKKLNFRIFHISDLKQGIGLNIDDAIDYILSLDRLKIGDNWHSDIRIGGFAEFSANRYEGVKLSTGFYNTRKLRLYTQGAITTGENSNGKLIKENMAILVGAKKSIKTKKIKIKGKAEYRFYGGRFNKGFKNTSPKYRKSNSGQTFGGTIGKTLYPIYAYNRTFSQWAVFTEYQTENDKNVSALSLTCETSYNLFSHLFIKLSLDINHILLENSKSFTYPFYTSSLIWEFMKGNYFSILATNKGMNLDVSYPTFYLFKKMNYGFSFVRDLAQ